MPETLGHCYVLSVMGTSSVCLPLQDESLFAFPNCKLLWIKASAKWLNVNIICLNQTPYVLYSINMGHMNEIRIYCIRHVVTVMWSTGISCVTSVPFTNHLLLPRGIVQCQSIVHFWISVEVIGHPGTFRLLWLLTCYFFHVLFLTYTICSRHIWTQRISQ